MSMHECEAYWQEFLRRPKEQKAIREEQKRLQKESADRMAALKNAKVKELQEALNGCTSEQQQLLGPILKAPGLLELLHDCLLRCGRDSSIFSKELKTDQSLLTRIMEKAEEYEKDPEAFTRQEEQLRALHVEASRPLDAADMNYLRERTWKDLPPAELAERMSKGEICPREEWIPGISKGKRPLNAKALEEHLAFGERLAREGREAYADQLYETAFLRFKQGVELLNWVEARDAINQRSVDDMYCMFLRNVAQAALQLEKYQEAIRACTTIIQELDEHDSKARYRRGKAYLLLGMAKCAKDDFLFILKSPYSTQEGVHAARLGLRELRRVVSRSEIDAKESVCKGLSGGLFSTGRARSGHFVLGDRFSGETELKTEERTPEHEVEAGDFRLPPRQAAAEDPNSYTTSSEGDASRLSSKACDGLKCLHSYPDKMGKEDDSKPPPLDLEETRNILIDLLDAYTSASAVSRLNELRSLADYDYRRVLIRARKFLPELQAPVLQRHGIKGQSHRSKMQQVERSASYWRHRDTEIAELTRECLEAIFGDVADIDG
ncbi:uncharacterized protein LOC34620920 [Cyclospora cayetanensis]|uniref:Uncharacterized protein LOC34620920 n=1 Tax=Cyclospora cayetanensis TaxID=88456 RepID=A0A6P6RTX8_9EIME|nr:uncharacterized protein LOC34620920 [Cyclospora cayetanensis]